MKQIHYIQVTTYNLERFLKDTFIIGCGITISSLTSTQEFKVPQHYMEEEPMGEILTP